MDTVPAEASREPAWSWPPDGIPLGSWALLGVAAAALIVGAVVRGFIGEEWYWNPQLLIQALPSALPIAVGAAIVAGAFRWPPARAWLLAGAASFAIHGVLLVAGDAWIFSWTNGTGMPPPKAEQSLMVARAAIGELALIAGFAALAIGLWQGGRWTAARARWRAAAIAVAAVAGAAAFVGVGLYIAAVLRFMPAPPPIEVVYWLFLGGEALGATALALAAVLAIPDRHRLPELTIAAGTVIWLVSRGGGNWSASALNSDPPMELVLLFARGTVAGLIVLAAGFAIARLFPARGRGPQEPRVADSSC